METIFTLSLVYQIKKQNQMQITRISQLSGKTHTLDLNVTLDQMERFEVRKITGEYVQTIFPELPKEEREFILTGITPEEWNSTFNFENE